MRSALASGMAALLTLTPIPASSEDAVSRIAAFYRDHTGVRHSLGACSAEAMDCSCFVQKLFTERFDLRLSRTTRTQVAELRFLKVPEIERPSQLVEAELCAGDLIYTFEGQDWTSGSRHVAVYGGAGRILHSSGRLGGVGWSSLAWLRRFELKGVYRAVGC